MLVENYSSSVGRHNKHGALISWTASSGLGWTQCNLACHGGGMIWMLGFVSRQCELDADRQACFSLVNIASGQVVNQNAR